MTSTPSTGLPAVYARDLEVEQEEHRWLIRTLWSRSAVGVLGGPPKAAKTFLALDLAVSVASGTPALGRFPVEAPGTALIYLAEDALPQVRARIDALCQHRGLDISRLDLAIITTPVLRLDTLEDQERLRATLVRFKPRLLLLDPLVRLHSRDENSAGEIAWLLSYFRDLQRTFDVAVILVHHMSKKHRSHPGQALRGSSDLHAWSDSSAYLTRHNDQITLTVEHRAAQPPQPMTLALVAGPNGSGVHLEVCTSNSSHEPPKPTLEHLILEHLHTTRSSSRSEIRAQLRVNNQRLGIALTALEQNGQITRTAEGWRLATSPAESPPIDATPPRGHALL
jgi:hypothetical protein